MISEPIENFSIFFSSIKLLPQTLFEVPLISVPDFNPEKFDLGFLNGCIPDH